MRLSTSDWGLKKCIFSLVSEFRAAATIHCSYAHWWVGFKYKIDFWHDQWLGGAMTEILGLPYRISRIPRARVSDFLHQGRWCLPHNFKSVSLLLLWRLRKMAFIIKSTLSFRALL